MIEAVHTVDETSSSVSHTMSGSYLIIGELVLYVVDKSEDMLHRAFYIAQIELEINESTLTILLNKEGLNSPQRSDDRLVEFIESVSSANYFNNEELLSSRKYGPENLFKADLSRFLTEIRTNVADYYRFEQFELNEYLNTYNSVPCVCGSLLTSLNLTLNTKSNKPVLHNLPKVHMTKSVESRSESQNLYYPKKENLNKKFTYYVDPRLSQNFLSVFNSLKLKLLNKGFNA